MADIKLIVDYGDVTKATKAVKDLGNAAVKASKGQVQSANSVDVVNKKSLATVHRQIAFSKKMENQKLKEAKATRALENETHRLALKYKPLYRSSKLYERSLEEINQANKLGVLSDKQRSASIASLNQQFKTGTGVFSTYANGMTKGSNRMGVAMQQTGYQVGDFLVQVQSGTNPMVAFGQQATQLVGVLYLLPQATLAAKVGIMGLKVSMGVLVLALGIFIPLATAIGAAFMRTREGANKASDGIKTFESSLVSAQGSTKQLTRDIEMLLNKMQDTDEYVYNQAIEKAEANLAKAQRILNQGPSGVGRGRTNVTGKEEAVAEAQLLVDNAQEQLDTFIALRKEKQGILTENQLASKRDRKRAEDLAGRLRLGYKNDREAEEKAEEARGERQKAVLEGIAIFRTANKKVKDEALKLEVDLEKARENFYEKTMSGLVDEFNMLKATNGKKGEALLIAKQQLKLDKLRAGVMQHGGTSAERNEAIEVLKATQALELQIYRQTEAEKKLTEEQRERKKVLADIEKQQSDLANSIASSMGNALMSMVDGTKSVKDAFKSMASDIIKELYRVLVVQEMVNTISGGIKKFMGISTTQANGGAWSGGSQIQAYANGGVVGSPTTFPMTGGKTGLMGEAGPEAIMPLKRGANGKLGVQMEGGGGQGNVVINQSFNFSANGDDSVKKLIAQAAPKIAQMTKSEIINDRRRGGSMKATFG